MIFSQPAFDSRLSWAWLFAFSGLWLVGCGTQSDTSNTTSQVGDQSIQPIYRGILVRPAQVNREHVAQWKQEGTSVVLVVELSTYDQIGPAIQILAEVDIKPEYWIEIARCPELADSHPEWMCSLQGHNEWQRLFPNWKPLDDSRTVVVKTYPWVPIVYRESFDSQLERVLRLLHDLPATHRLWLNDLQSGPSACGCGHPLCRWAGDYGPIKTATTLEDPAAAEFLKALRQTLHNTEVVPIWTTECEQADEHEACCGVECFEGICWKAYTRQLMPVAEISPRIGVQCFYKMFERDLDRYGQEAEWVLFALQSFQTMPPIRGGQAIEISRLIPLLQGWDVDQNQIDCQIKLAVDAGAAGYLVVHTPIEQSWRPQAFDILPDGRLKAVNH